MSNYRTKRQIMIEILEKLNQEKRGMRPTRLSFKVGAQYNYFKGYIDELIELGILEKFKFMKSYKLRLTTKGQELHTHFFNIQSIERGFGLNER